ncbi:hypothetical protein KZ686_00160 [Cupriavidus cauae]|uniref:hypothetical protein n=1 Tax=Cupriavidus cauae TaxID=2608999 RepID=UPI0022432F5C|nr:hypothetical protein [Cupriavidus cauae]UZN49142.1 hypothetical protein KZ686_00160 [Cupriavidus cauae]
MEPVTSALVSSAKTAVVKYVGEFIKGKVIERWSQYRAEKFYDSFLEEFQKQADVRCQSADLDDLLLKVSERDEVSSLLFDAYRRVCLSASRELGPRVIGLLTAEIVLEGRTATEGEEQMFQAAETLNDKEFLEFAGYLKAQVPRLSEHQRECLKALGWAKILVADDQAHCELEGGYLRPAAPFEIGGYVGIWALRLKNIGLISEERDEEVWVVPHDSERHIDQDMRCRSTKDYLVTTPECHRLAYLIDRASRARRAS